MPRPTETTQARPVVVDLDGPAPDAWPKIERALLDRVDLEKSRPSQIPKDAFKLDRMHAIMEALGNPHRDVRTIHIAGSKGKGSTAEMTAAALAGCGYAVGLYTSPHLVDLRERIRIGNDPIDRPHAADVLERVARAAAPAEKKHGPASFFEILTAAAFTHFADLAVDIAVIEVGLGGRLDSTNVITPMACGLTAIHLEHTALLGSTLPEIAREKAGIMKPGVRAVSVPQPPEVLAVFRETAERVGARLDVLGETIEFSHRFEYAPDLGPHHEVCLTTPRSNFEHIPVPLKGEHQAYNASLVLALLDALREQGFPIRDREVAQGLARTPNAGRLEVLWNNPRILADGAHTRESVEALIKTIGSTLKFDNLIMVFGCAADKDTQGMLAKLAAGADKIIFTKATDSARAAEPRDLQRRFAEVSGKMTQTAPTVKDALNLAAKAAQRGDLICATGSFLIAGEAKRLLLEKSKSVSP
ncbi:MAG: bifunctional folylpolyglutamate synthase/dihydrofolate synthase [Phycisphaeraceae bacterium]|nr:MAG: bifunctional folylpolyglutamate synthase/dihydrofolate synthase [Phycisphaeraceae bacterium]